MTVYVITEEFDRRYDGSLYTERFVMKVVDSEQKALNYVKKQIRADAKFHKKYPRDLEFRYGKGETLEQHDVPTDEQIKEYWTAESYYVRYHDGKDSESKWYFIESFRVG